MLLCAGDEDRSTQSLRRRALVLAFRAQSDVVVDLRDLAFADTTLMLDLAMLSHRLRRRGRRLLLQAPQPQIMALIEMVGLHRLPGVDLLSDGSPQPAAA
ncbi:MAG: STAS domain-containing protein [Actinomycetota bacterium]|nr:STAS domain-containing protein [Actinomycetota bacterium]